MPQRRRCGAAPSPPSPDVHRTEHAVEIDAPASAIFPYLVESEKRLAWMGALVESEQLTGGRPGIGTRFRDVFEEYGQRIEIDAELVEVDPGRRLRVRLDANGFDAVSTQELEEARDRTRVKAVVETDYKMLAARLLGPVVARHAQKQLEADLARLKEIVEADTGEQEAEP